MGWLGPRGPASWAEAQVGQGGLLFFFFVLFSLLYFLFIYFTFSVLVLFPIILVLLKYTRSI